ncbi:hypothetical protein BS50DRAFT_208383 [Corynespora cassiicola Philippines]|uniref:Uncharacterized protein n=1 Tax=Corynespora cassiicola Philippines TaxID=1448308 RepID=A0A2T2N4J4_CORCC|nr:hypothetical protein BS50DRAFT_208383 [Corynespora cassiicola Philippines]
MDAPHELAFVQRLYHIRKSKIKNKAEAPHHTRSPRPVSGACGVPVSERGVASHVSTVPICSASYTCMRASGRNMGLPMGIRPSTQRKPQTWLWSALLHGRGRARDLRRDSAPILLCDFPRASFDSAQLGNTTRRHAWHDAEPKDVIAMGEGATGCDGSLSLTAAIGAMCEAGLQLPPSPAPDGGNSTGPT